MAITRREFMASAALLIPKLSYAKLHSAAKPYSDGLMRIAEGGRAQEVQKALMPFHHTPIEERYFNERIGGGRLKNLKLQAQLICKPEPDEELCKSYMAYCRDIVGFISRQLRRGSPFVDIVTPDVSYKPVPAYIAFQAHKHYIGTFMLDGVYRAADMSLPWCSGHDLKRNVRKAAKGYDIEEPGLTFWCTDTRNLAQLLSGPAIDTVRFLFMNETTPAFRNSQNQYLDSMVRAGDEAEMKAAFEIGVALAGIFAREYLPDLSGRYDIESELMLPAPTAQRSIEI